MAADRTAEAVHKSAVLLVSLGADAAARVLSHLSDEQVELLIREMTRLGHIASEERDHVLEEFQDRILQRAGGEVGGPEYARRLLEQAVGPEKAGRMLGQLAPEEPAPLTLAEILESTSPESLAALVADEHPQLIALLIGQLSLEQAAAFLSALSPDVQGPVAARLAEMEAPAPIAIQHLERFLAEKLSGGQTGGVEDAVGGPRRVADILSRVRRSVESFVLTALEQQSPALAAKVNQFRFTFEDLLQLEGRIIQRVLRDVESDTLRLAMKGLDEERQQVIYTNMSERAGARLREDLENSGPVRLRDVEAAQSSIVGLARTLEESGEIQLRAGGEAGGEDEEVIA